MSGAPKFLSGNAVMRELGKRNRASFRAWQMQHGIAPDHVVGRNEYFLRADIIRALDEEDKDSEEY